MLGLLLLTCHMIGDYIFQTDKQAKAKLENKTSLVLHCLTYTLAFTPLLFMGMPWFGLIIIFWSHVLIDHRRWVHNPPWPPKAILVDQTLHLMVLCFVGLALF